MVLTLVSHASVLVREGNTSILVDPWLIGDAFNDSWALLCPPAEIDWKEINYIYITHEHPDHCHFPSLKSIPDDNKKNIEILLSFHASPRLRNALEKLGFKVRELGLHRWIGLNKDLSVLVGSVGTMDSFIAIKSLLDDKVILNMNDCILSDSHMKRIKRMVGEVDILLTQFSFANWVGNDRDYGDEAGRKIAQVRRQGSIFEPRWIVPFASFIYFCSEDNFRQNAWANKPSSLVASDIPNLAVLKVGEKIDVSFPIFESLAAASFYDDKFKEIRCKPLPASVSKDVLLDVIRASISDFSNRIPSFFLRKINSLSFWVSDLNFGIEICFAEPKVEALERELCRYEIHSQRLWYFFKYSWGPGTIEVAGTYFDRYPGAPRSKYFFFQNLISTQFIRACPSFS